ncbi:MAG: hypothetical protein JXR91_16445 [Deltaproteobacteria bacterium]|nr:hypothetical protein [Deltaproteobacteria bacterium]
MDDSNLTFEWVDDSSEKRYDIVVNDAFGNEIWTQTMEGVSGGNASIIYDGPALEDGLYYQFKVTSFSKLDGGTPLSTTEDLKGVFFK